VLGGTLYAVLKKMYQTRWERNQSINPDRTPLELSGKSLFEASEQFQADGGCRRPSITCRRARRLSPDLGRAHPSRPTSPRTPRRETPRARDWFRAEFVARGLAATDADLDVTIPEADRQALEQYLATVDMDVLASSDWAAYEFVNSNRKWLGVPAGISFHVRPRLDGDQDLPLCADAGQSEEGGTSRSRSASASSR